jgi:hypothetical protein
LSSPKARILLLAEEPALSLSKGPK